jgi:hypothetical protein
MVCAVFRRFIEQHKQDTLCNGSSEALRKDAPQARMQNEKTLISLIADC